MELIEPHLHAESLSWSNLREMSTSCIRAMIAVAVWTWRGGVDTYTQFALVNRVLHHESWRAEENNIQLFAGIGVPAVAVPKDVEKFFLQMEEYLKKPRVVAVGEVGFDPRSQTCKDLRRQEEILSLQLKMAKDNNLPVILHTPPDLSQVKLKVQEKYEKREFMEKSIELIHKAGLLPERVVLDHLDAEEWVKFALDNGCYAGISIQEWRGTSPEQVACWADNFGPQRVLLNSDASNLPSDHLAVPKTVFYLRKRKASEDKIKKIVYQNPINFYGLSLKKEI